MKTKLIQFCLLAAVISVMYQGCLGFEFFIKSIPRTSFLVKQNGDWMDASTNGPWSINGAVPGVSDSVRYHGNMGNNLWINGSAGTCADIRIGTEYGNSKTAELSVVSGSIHVVGDMKIGYQGQTSTNKAFGSVSFENSTATIGGTLYVAWDSTTNYPASGVLSLSNSQITVTGSLELGNWNSGSPSGNARLVLEGGSAVHAAAFNVSSSEAVIQVKPDASGKAGTVFCSTNMNVFRGSVEIDTSLYQPRAGEDFVLVEATNQLNADAVADYITAPDGYALRNVDISDGVYKKALILTRSWFSDYSSALFNPQNTDYASVLPTVINSAGYFGGWYGYWYYDDQTRTGYAPNMWKNIGKVGIRRMFYFDNGEVGDFAAFFDTNGVVKNAWSISAWTGTPAIATARWMGLETFMQNPAWSPYKTAEDYNLPAFTHPDGSAIVSNFYSALSKKTLNGQVNPSFYFNENVTSWIATNSRLVDISEQLVDPVDNKLKWKTVTQYHIDSSNPQMRDYRLAEAQKLMEELRPDGTHIDNMGDNNLLSPQQSAFGDWSVYGFRAYLTNRFSSAELSGRGITNASVFDIAGYVQSGPAVTSAVWTEDIIWNEYKIYKAQGGADYQRTLYQGIKQKAAELNLDFDVSGNLIPLWPGAALSKGLFDTADFEWRAEIPYSGFSRMDLPPNGHSVSYVSRLGANISRTPYCWINLYVATTTAAKPELHKVMAFDGIANRGILNYNYDFMGYTHPGTDESAAFINDWVKVMASYGLSSREYAADIGLLFNPWCDVAESTVSGMQFNQFIEEYSGWCDYLADTYHQWDVVDSEDMTADLLAKFPVLVLPSVTVLTDQQVNLLKTYAQAGGKLIITGGTGKRFGADSSLLSRPAGAFDGFSATGFRSDTNYPGRTYRLNNRDTAAASEMNSLLAYTDFTPSVYVNPAIKAGVNLNRQMVAGKTRLTLDINNYGGYNPAGDTVSNAVETWITVQLPDDLVNETLDISYIYAGMSDPLTPIQMPGERIIQQPALKRVLIQVYATKYFQTVFIKAAE